MTEEVSIEFDELKNETEAAFLLSIENKDHWLPKSLARIYEKNKKAYIPEWLALKKGLI